MPHPAGASAAYMGRQATRRRSQAVGSEGRGPTSYPAHARRSPSRARDATGLARAPLAAHRADLLSNPRRTGAGLARRPARVAFLRAARSRPSADRSAGCSRPLARDPGTRHPHREGSEPGPRAVRSRLGRQVSCATPADAARGQEWSDLCAPELAKTRARRARIRLAVVRHLVWRLADSEPVDAGDVTRGRTTDVACGDWLAPPRPDSCRRAAGVGS